MLKQKREESVLNKVCHEARSSKSRVHLIMFVDIAMAESSGRQDAHAASIRGKRGRVLDL